MTEHAHNLSRLYFHAEMIHHRAPDHRTRSYVKDAEARLVEHLKRQPEGHAEHCGCTMQLHSVSIEGKTMHYVKFTGELPIDHSITMRAGIEWRRGAEHVKIGMEVEHVKRKKGAKAA